MSPRDLPVDVVAFLQERISGTDELEALLLVRSDTSRGWTAAAVAKLLGLPESWAGPALAGLCEAELLGLPESWDGHDEEQRFWYRPGTPALDAVVATLAGLYDEQRADVLRILNENAVERIRAAAARRFGGVLEGRQKGGETQGHHEGRASRDEGRARERRDEGGEGT